MTHGVHLLGLNVCVDCILIAANGETSEPFDYEAWKRSVTDKWGVGAYLIPGMEDLGFSDTSCGFCGNTYAGDRFTAYVDVTPAK